MLALITSQLDGREHMEKKTPESDPDRTTLIVTPMSRTSKPVCQNHANTNTSQSPSDLGRADQEVFRHVIYFRDIHLLMWQAH